jgi:GT2 family glycosyltransferase
VTKRLAAVIVSYNSEGFLENCVASLRGDAPLPDLAIVIVDNASRDQGFVAQLCNHYPGLTVMLNQENLGFSKACNQGIRACPADYFLLINPDCVVRESALEKCLTYLEAHADVGIVGCRVENPDGSLQLACRRSIPRPSSAFYRLSGLGRLFPRSPRFGRYNYTYLDERATAEVEAVSGSFLMFRAKMAGEIGLLDEDFFLYGEDLDFCRRAGLKGWKVVYYPEATVTHHKRRSSSQNVAAANYHFYDAMKIFYRKHYGEESGVGRLKRRALFLAIDTLHLAARARNRLFGRSDVGSRG